MSMTTSTSDPSLARTSTTIVCLPYFLSIVRPVTSPGTAASAILRASSSPIFRTVRAPEEPCLCLGGPRRGSDRAPIGQNGRFRASVNLFAARVAALFQLQRLRADLRQGLWTKLLVHDQLEGLLLERVASPADANVAHASRVVLQLDVRLFPVELVHDQNVLIAARPHHLLLAGLVHLRSVGPIDCRPPTLGVAWRSLPWVCFHRDPRSRVLDARNPGWVGDELPVLVFFRVLTHQPDGAVRRLREEGDLLLHQLARGEVHDPNNHRSNAVDRLGQVGDDVLDVMRCLGPFGQAGSFVHKTRPRLQRQPRIVDLRRRRLAETIPIEVLEILLARLLHLLCGSTLLLDRWRLRASRFSTSQRCQE